VNGDDDNVDDDKYNTFITIADS